MSEKQVQLVQGVYFVGSRSHRRTIAEIALLDTPNSECWTVFDIGIHEIVAIANPPIFFFDDPADRSTIMSSAQIISGVVRPLAKHRTAGIEATSKMGHGDVHRYSIHCCYPDFGPVRLDFESRPLLIEDGRTVLAENRIRFNPVIASTL